MNIARRTGFPSPTARGAPRWNAGTAKDFPRAWIGRSIWVSIALPESGVDNSPQYPVREDRGDGGLHRPHDELGRHAEELETCGRCSRVSRLHRERPRFVGESERTHAADEGPRELGFAGEELQIVARRGSMAHRGLLVRVRRDPLVVRGHRAGTHCHGRGPGVADGDVQPRAGRPDRPL